jgi:hypothetical protein
MAYFVKQVAIWMMELSLVSPLAGGDLLEVPSSVQMMDFVG